MTFYDFLGFHRILYDFLVLPQHLKPKIYIPINGASKDFAGSVIFQNSGSYLMTKPKT